MIATDHDTLVGPHQIQKRYKEVPAVGEDWSGSEEYVIACSCGAFVGARIDETDDQGDRAAARAQLAKQRHADHAKS